VIAPRPQAILSSLAERQGLEHELARVAARRREIASRLLDTDVVAASAELAEAETALRAVLGASAQLARTSLLDLLGL